MSVRSSSARSEGNGSTLRTKMKSILRTRPPDRRARAQTSPRHMGSVRARMKPTRMKSIPRTRPADRRATAQSSPHHVESVRARTRAKVETTSESLGLWLPQHFHGGTRQKHVRWLRSSLIELVKRGSQTSPHHRRQGSPRRKMRIQIPRRCRASIAIPTPQR